MKSLILMTAFASLGFFACNNKAAKENSVIGKWKVVKILDPQTGDAMEKESTEHIVLDLSKDGKFEAINDSAKQNGTYTYTADKKQMVITINRDKGDEPKIEQYDVSFAADTMILKGSMGVVKLLAQ